MTKIKFIDNYSGRSINVVINLPENAKDDYIRDKDKGIIYDKMSDNQRKKIEDFFGKEMAYHTTIEII